MEISIARQAYALICSVLTGIAMGAFYDLMRVIRLKTNYVAVTDIFFWLVSGFALFYLGMDAGDGSLHILMILAVLLGFFAYMKLLSKSVTDVFEGFFRLSGRLYKPMKNLFVKASKLVKKFFSKIKNRFRMMKKPRMKGSDAGFEEAPKPDGTDLGAADAVCRSEPARRKKRAIRGTDADGHLKSRAAVGAGRKRKTHGADHKQ